MLCYSFRNFSGEMKKKNSIDAKMLCYSFRNFSGEMKKKNSIKTHKSVISKN